MTHAPESWGDEVTRRERRAQAYDTARTFRDKAKVLLYAADAIEEREAIAQARDDVEAQTNAKVAAQALKKSEARDPAVCEAEGGHYFKAVDESGGYAGDLHGVGSPARGVAPPRCIHCGEEP